MFELAWPRIPRQYFCYAAVSLLCMCIDIATFLLLLRCDATPGISAGFGYMAGTAAHWTLSTRLVFQSETISGGRGRLRQRFAFLLSALCGTALTILTVNIGVACGLDARLAKILAIAISFNLVWLLRRRLVFA